MTTVFGLRRCHIDSEMPAARGEFAGDGPAREGADGGAPVECPECRVIVPASGYCRRCARFVAPGMSSRR